MTSRDADSGSAQLKADLSQIQKDIAALTETMKRLGSDRGQEGVNAVKRAADTTERQARAAVQSIEDQISERPFPSVLVAFGLGFLIGKLLDR